MLTCSRQFKRGHFYPVIVFLSGLPFLATKPFARICDNFLNAMESNKRYVNFVLFFCHSCLCMRLRTKMEILMSSEYVFFYDCSENEPACVSGCSNCCPKNGTVGTRGEFVLHIL